MCPKNDTTDSINQYVMNLIPGEASTLLSADSVGEEQAAMYPTEFLNSITPNGLPPHRLCLKVYASDILLCSIDPTQGMCNSTRLTVKSFLNRIIPKLIRQSMEIDIPSPLTNFTPLSNSHSTPLSSTKPQSTYHYIMVLNNVYFEPLTSYKLD